MLVTISIKLVTDKVPATSQHVGNDDGVDDLFANLDDVGREQLNSDLLFSVFGLYQDLN